MSLLTLIKAQFGKSATPANNFVIDASADNGTLKLARGNAGATTQDILTVDAAGNVTVSYAGLGYGTGAGGAVTQATSKLTLVTLNKPTGQITMNNAALAAGASATFSVMNSLVGTTDVVVVSSPFSNSDSYRIECSRCAGGFFNIRVTNISGGSLSEAVIINFAIIKGSVS